MPNEIPIQATQSTTKIQIPNQIQIQV